MQTLRIVFMGTPDFAVPCLQTLLDSPHSVVGVFTQPDKPQGRKMVLTPPPVKVLAAENGVPVFQPEKMKDPATLEQLKILAPDLIVVVAYGRILPRAVLELPRYGCINVHASLLPKYRGAAPIQWAILDGETETGVTIMQMDAGLDTGDMLLVKKTPIDPEETAEMLFERLSALGAQALAEILPRLDDLHPVPQPTGDFGYAKMISKSMSPLDWNHSAAQLHDQVRGLYSWPCATTTIGGKTVKVLSARLSDQKGSTPGAVIESKGKLVVACGDGGGLELLTVQPQGKKAMDAKAFLAGHPVAVGTVLGA
jgi:methionyl-tRNA formyltransferase